MVTAAVVALVTAAVAAEDNKGDNEQAEGNDNNKDGWTKTRTIDYCGDEVKVRRRRTTTATYEAEDKENYCCHEVMMMKRRKRRSRTTTTRMDNNKDSCFAVPGWILYTRRTHGQVPVTAAAKSRGYANPPGYQSNSVCP